MAAAASRLILFQVGGGQGIWSEWRGPGKHYEREQHRGSRSMLWHTWERRRCERKERGGSKKIVVSITEWTNVKRKVVETGAEKKPAWWKVGAAQKEKSQKKVKVKMGKSQKVSLIYSLKGQRGVSCSNGTQHPQGSQTSITVSDNRPAFCL